MTVSPERFGEHLATLRAAGMHAVTAADVARAFGAGKPLPDNAVMISFDDGRADALMFADPLLEQAGMKATMFVISSATKPADLLRRVGPAPGRPLGTLGHRGPHPRLSPPGVAGGGQLPSSPAWRRASRSSGYRRRVQQDLERNHAAIEAHIGRRPVALAYPFGAYGAERRQDPPASTTSFEENSARYVLAFHQDQQEASRSSTRPRNELVAPPGSGGRVGCRAARADRSSSRRRG